MLSRATHSRPRFGLASSDIAEIALKLLFVDHRTDLRACPPARGRLLPWPRSSFFDKDVVQPPRAPPTRSYAVHFLPRPAKGIPRQRETDGEVKVSVSITQQRVFRAHPHLDLG